ncbi:M43 family zinc metalloprotease [Xanthomarina sp. F2636L]|uniref:M43 family zinc metalloprotease n=1 Tax=Xanthomarina sp. F2636L TaxID=2996018 RepID=UPI00225E2FE1|nr:M43 family zinc metalloprotease [Xanthomarina sp. F2636L]MCX7551876.1 M43 family zinc metalloprotease [Xanthomarina sp. F2636L]
MKNILFLLSIFVCYNLSAQKHCAQDEYQQKIFNEDPSLRPENNPSYQELEEFTRNFIPSSSHERASNIGGLEIGYDYIIPVVVHIIHNNGPENISDKAVERAIEMLNIFYAGESAFDQNIDPDFVAVRGAFTGKKLKFVLAKFDPDGNATNGIDRQVDATYTYQGDNSNMRLMYHWPRENYFNIYVVAQSWTGSSSSGFATFPPSVDGSANAYLDGHVMSAWAFGEHGEMWQTWYHNLSHEVGHWLNVYHIWANAGGNGNSYYCNLDDSVADTPNTKGNSLSDLDYFPGVGTVFNCSTKDNYTNMMDYTSATYAMFTEGQKARMEAALNSSVADRNNLWSVNNVLTTLYGCTDGVDSDSDLIPDACDTCPNSYFNDSDEDGICDDLDACNGFPDVNVDANPNAIDACDPLLPIINFNSETVLSYDASEDNGVTINYDQGATIHVSVNGWKAINLNYNITPNTILEFDFKSTIDGETHYIGIDNDLQLDPILAYKLYGTEIVTPTANYNVDYDTYQDTDLFSYKHYTIPIGNLYNGNASYLFFTAGNDTYSEVWYGGYFYPGGGRYNDATSFFRNVKLYESEVLSTNEVRFESNISIYPNPTVNQVTISTVNGLKLQDIQILDARGKMIKTLSFNQSQKGIIYLNELSSGIYFIKIISNEGVSTKKIIKL